MTVAPAIEHFGDIIAISSVTGKDFLRDPGIKNTMLGDGLATMAACALGGVILIVAALAATDFDRAFTVFHGIFFPGKENWLFDPATDPVILLLPEEFFRNCAIAIAASLLLLCLVLILTGRRQKK